MPLSESDISRIGEVIKIHIEPINTRLAKGDEKFERIEKDIAEHKHAIQGNGKPGLLADVQQLKSEAQRQAGSSQKWGIFWVRLWLVIIGAIVPLVLAGTLAAGWALLKIIPHP